MANRSTQHTKLLFFTIIFMIVNVNVFSKDSNQNIVDKKISELKDFAFCRCLYKEYEKDSIFNDDGTISAIIELGTLGFEDYEIVNQYVENYLDTLKILSYNNSRLGLLKCIKLYHSDILDSIIMEIIFKDNK